MEDSANWPITSLDLAEDFIHELKLFKSFDRHLILNQPHHTFTTTLSTSGKQIEQSKGV